MGLGVPFPGWLTHVAGKLTQAIGRRTQLLTMWTLPWDFWSVLTVYLWIPQSKGKAQSECPNVFYDLASEVSYHDFHDILIAT